MLLCIFQESSVHHKATCFTTDGPNVICPDIRPSMAGTINVNAVAHATAGLEFALSCVHMLQKSTQKKCRVLHHSYDVPTSWHVSCACQCSNRDVKIE